MIQLAGGVFYYDIFSGSEITPLTPHRVSMNRFANNFGDQWIGNNGSKGIRKWSIN